jgi:hypothetical protein
MDNQDVANGEKVGYVNPAKAVELMDPPTPR